jgi:hypothetical protein
MKKLLLITIIIFAFILTGCEEGKPTNNPVVTQTPEATQAPASTQKPVAQEKYTDEQLVEMTIQYRNERGLYVPLNVEVDGEKDGVVAIHLYDIGEDATATTDWYYIDRATGKGTNILEETIDLNDHDYLKRDSTKEWVYDADYEKDVKEESYKTGYEEYFVKDIKAPFFNIASQDAENANFETKKVFNSALEVYKAGLEDKMSFVEECDYKTYQKGNTIAVIYTYGHGSTDVVYPDYYAYCFSTETGDRLTYEEIYTLAGFNENDLNEKVKKAITDYSKGVVPEDDDFDKYNNLSLDYYAKAVKEGTLQAFIDNDGELYIITKMHFPAGREEKFEILKIEK